jgi:asparagine synthase (glutamine-hydrolysing)
VLYICQHAREHGIKVLLSGAGGDDLFTGYRRHLALRTEALWRWMPRLARGLLESATGRLDQRWPPGRRLTKLFRGASLDGDARIVSFFEWFPAGELSALYTPEFRAAAAVGQAAEPMLEFLKAMPRSASALQKMLALEQRFFLADHNLVYTDKMSMATGVEVRVPFLDTDLVDFAARIPDALRQRGGTGKWVLKRAMEPYLPRDVIYRPKTGFTAPVRRWIAQDLRPMVSDVLGADSLRRRGMLCPKAVGRLLRANEEGRVDGSHTILAMLCVELWCRSFLDRPLG